MSDNMFQVHVQTMIEPTCRNIVIVNMFNRCHGGCLKGAMTSCVQGGETTYEGILS